MYKIKQRLKVANQESTKDGINKIRWNIDSQKDHQKVSSCFLLFDWMMVRSYVVHSTCECVSSSWCGIIDHLTGWLTNHVLLVFVNSAILIGLLGQPFYQNQLTLK